MNQRQHIFYKCLGFQTNIKFKKPLFFYHVPKCAGTTFTVLISHLISKNYRINGTLFKNNDKGGTTAYENFNQKEDLIKSSSLDFLYGHVPFEIHNKVKDKFKFITILREPIQRCISHYTWALNRGYFSDNDKIDDLFNKKRLPKNVITNQFSGIGISTPDTDNAVELSYSNLINNIDFIIDIEDTYNLLNKIISSYDFPNLFFQNQQVTNKRTNLSDEEINTIKNNNKKDIELYSKLVKNKIIKNNIFEKKLSRKKNVYLYSSPDLHLDGEKTKLLNEKKIIEIEKKLSEAKYEVKLVK